MPIEIKMLAKISIYETAAEQGAVVMVMKLARITYFAELCS